MKAFSKKPSAERSKAASPSLVIVEQYMRQFVPTEDLNATSAFLKTSNDIVDDLADMCEVDTDEVASKLIELGFSTMYCADGRHGWLMQPRQI